MNVKFLVFTDLHVDIMHDSVARMEIILRAAHREKVDFLLHLGDIMYPETEFLMKYAPQSIEKRKEHAWFVCDRDDEKKMIRLMISESGFKLYGVLGNHDMDSCDKKTALLYYGMPSPYYSFTEGGVRFIALDGNFIQTSDALVDFDHCNYSMYKRKDTSFLPQNQLEWLENTIRSSLEPCVLLSHAPLGDDLLNIHNMKEVWTIIERVNKTERKVILAMNGHNHVDGLSARQGVPFFSVNSASNIWLGERYRSVRYSEMLCKVYPHLSSCAPYYNPLYAVVTINESGIYIQGTDSVFVGKTPQELGFPQEASYFEPCAYIKSRFLSFSPLAGDGKVIEK